MTPPPAPLQDADSYWHLAPPSRLSLVRLLAGDEPLVLSIGWRVERDAPPQSDHGSPLCAGAATVPLLSATRQALVDLLEGGGGSAPRLRNTSSSSRSGGGGQGPDSGPPEGLYPLFWLLRGDSCTNRPLQAADVGGGRLPGSSGGGGLEWADQWVACNASLQLEGDEEESARSGWDLDSRDAGDKAWDSGGFSLSSTPGPMAEDGPAQRQLLVAGSGDSQGSGSQGSSSSGSKARRRAALAAAAAGGGAWWRLDCATVDAQGQPVDPPAGTPAGAFSPRGGGDAATAQGSSACGSDFGGPRVVAVLERVQGGLIGQTLSKLGIAGLYSVFVYSIGR